MVIFHSYVAVYQRIILPKTPAPQHASYAQVPGHRGDEACDAGRTAGRRVVGAADAVVLDGLTALKKATTGGNSWEKKRHGKNGKNMWLPLKWGVLCPINRYDKNDDKR